MTSETPPSPEAGPRRRRNALAAAPAASPACLTEADAARYIGFSRIFLRIARSQGPRQGRTPGPPFLKVGRAVRYLLADLDAWLLAHRRLQ
ncbi:hypothetical protein [Luteitalea sp.]